MFAQRSYKKELLDAENISQKDLFRNLYELEVINNWLGGYKPTIKGIKQIIDNDLKNKTTPNPSLKVGEQKALLLPKEGLATASEVVTYTIADIGSGGGDTLRKIADWGRKNGLKLNLIGIDLKEDAILYAKKASENYPEISFIQSDYREIHKYDLKIDIFISALFCHHLLDDQIETLLLYVSAHAHKGFVINDLHRNFFAYHSIKILTNIFSKSYLVKNDAKLSVLRGFDKAFWSKIITNLKANNQQNSDKNLHQNKINYSISWCWAFRWLIVGEK